LIIDLRSLAIYDWAQVEEEKQRLGWKAQYTMQYTWKKYAESSIGAGKVLLPLRLYRALAQ
jgi:hypothetical protein